MTASIPNRRSNPAVEFWQQESRSSQPAQVIPSGDQQWQTLTTKTLGWKRRNKTHIQLNLLAKALAGDRQCLFSFYTQANYIDPEA